MVFTHLQAPLDTKVGEASALNATIFSQSLSNKNKTNSLETNAAGQKASSGQGQDDGSADQPLEESECCGQGDGSCKSTTKSW